jgi:hypothetical protein
MSIIASLFIAAAILVAGRCIGNSGKRIADAFAPASDAAFVPLEELLKEQYPEQFSNEPSDFILEEDFILLD